MGSLKRGAEDILDQPATPPPSPRSPVSPKRGAPPAPEPAEAPKAPRIAGITALEVWKAVQDWGESQESSNPFAQQRISNVADYVDQLLDPELVHVARKEQLKKFWDRHAFSPVLKEEVPRGAQVFGHKWVDKNSRGKYKSRFTCADVKARYTKEQEAEMNVFVPTPTAESHAFLEVYALLNGYMTRSLDIVAAFLIGEDRGASEGNWVYVRAPVEWYELFQEWLATVPPADRSRYQHRFRDVLFRLDGNLYGRRTAGSVYRDELEEIMIGKFTKRFQFERGVKDTCVFRCKKTHVVLIHHIDDIRAAGPEEHLNFLFDEEFPGTVRSRPESSSG